MSISSADALELGSTVAKSVLAVLLNDPSIALDSATDFAGFFRRRTNDVFAQKAAGRRFDEIGERVALSLTPFISAEAPQLPEEEKRAAIVEAIAALRNSSISADLLARLNLDPNSLATHIADHGSSSLTLLSADGVEFFNRLVRETSVRVIDVSASIPFLTERVFSELLVGQDTLLEKAEGALEEIRRIRVETESLDPRRSTADFEINYRLAVARRLDEIKLFGTPHPDQIRRYPLTIAYITLTATIASPSLPDELTASRSRHQGQLLSEPASMAANSVNDFLASGKRLLVKGFAGSGKTTLLQWIAVQSASRSFEDSLAGWNDLVPFFVRLRDSMRRGLPTPDEFVGLTVPSHVGAMPQRWSHQILSTGRAIVLIDGVDEVSEDYREDVRDWLDELLAAFPEATFVITSRPHAVDGRWFSKAGFTAAELEPLSLDSIDTFVDYWHKAVAIDLHENGGSLHTTAEHLKAEIRRSTPIARLATNPLLCAMICTLHHHREEDLPSDRIELYRACCELLLERRERARRIELPDYPIIGLRQKWVLITDLAYWMMRNGWTQAAEGEVDRRLQLKLLNLEGVDPTATGASVRKFFVERAGLLREPLAEYVDFAHRTFQEYLAAIALVEEGDIGLLISNAASDQWREVAILAAGLANREARKELISGLIERGDKATRGRRMIHLLAVACLETAIELDPDVKAEVRSRLATAVPPRNMTQAKDLASAGELAVPYLRAPVQRLRGPVAAACVRALSLIGTESALDVLATYGSDDRLAVREELVRAWRTAPDPDAFGSKLVPLMYKGAEALRVFSVPSLFGFEHLTELKYLSAVEGQRITSLHPIGELKSLRRLVLSRFRRIVDLEDLRPLTELTELDLSWFDSLMSIRALKDLRSLQSLRIFRAPRLKSLEGLQDSTTIKRLSLSALGSVADWELVGELKALESLSLDGIQGNDMDFLGNLEGLKDLSIEGPTYVPRRYLEEYYSVNDQSSEIRPKVPGNTLVRETDISGLAKLKSLTHLQLSGLGGATKLDPLAELDSLTHLQYSDPDPEIALSVLAGLKNLQVLYLSGLRPGINLTPITGIVGLKRLAIEGRTILAELDHFTPPRGLERLDISGVPRSASLQGFSQLTGLTHLSLVGASLEIDLSPLSRLKRLTNLILVGEGDVTGWEAIAHLPSLRSIEVIGLNVPDEFERVTENLRVRTAGSRERYTPALRSWSLEGWKRAPIIRRYRSPILDSDDVGP